MTSTNKIKKLFQETREWATPIRTSSAFLDKGVLTPDEFVQAGDELVFRCPTWSWQGGDASKRKSFLPDSKQYLVTRNVPCPYRVDAMETQMDMEAMDGDDGEDWMVSHVKKKGDANFEDEFDILDEDGEVVAAQKAQDVAVEQKQGTAGGADDDEYADMAGFEDDNVITDDPDAAAPPVGNAAATGESNVLQTRTYDLSITYDKYYATPRIFMVGMSPTGQPLSGEEMMQDVMSDYANKTVTIEPHPHIGVQHASIHPCQHGKVMKVIVKNLIKASSDGDDKGNAAPSVENYLFIFLKFVSSIIPTINYDFTMGVDASTKK